MYASSYRCYIYVAHVDVAVTMVAATMVHVLVAATVHVLVADPVLQRLIPDVIVPYMLRILRLTCTISASLYMPRCFCLLSLMIL